MFTKGKFITCEGPEGSGKSTHSRKLAGRLRALGIEVLETREPGGTLMGEAIRQMLQFNSAGEPPVEAAEVLLFCASRAQLVAKVIKPALARGVWVICDRFTDSTLAYQGYGRGLDLGVLRAINNFATAGLTPDVTLLFDIDVTTSRQRLHDRARKNGETMIDRFEVEPLEFHEKIRDGFLRLAASEPQRLTVIDSSRSHEIVAWHVWQTVASLLSAAQKAKTKGERCS